MVETVTDKGSEERPTRDIDRTRNLILAAASEEFAESGLDGGRVDSIAKKAGVNKAMIYYIFGSKRELYLSALEMLFVEKTRGVDPPPGDSELTELLSNYFDAFAKNPAIVRMMIHDLADGASALRELKTRRPDLFEPFAMVSDLLKEWIAEGKIREIDADKAVVLSIAVIVSLIVLEPYVDLVRDRETPEYEKLSDMDSWKFFLAENVLRLLKP